MFDWENCARDRAVAGGSCAFKTAEIVQMQTNSRDGFIVVGIILNSSHFGAVSYVGAYDRKSLGRHPDCSAGSGISFLRMLALGSLIFPLISDGARLVLHQPRDRIL